MKKYETGYMKPPRETQFKPGQSGNTKGRPVGRKTTYKLLDDLLSERVAITKEGKQVKINKKTLILLQAVNSATKGNMKAIQTLFPHMLAVDAKNEERTRAIASLKQDDAKIIELAFKGSRDEQTTA